MTRIILALLMLLTGGCPAYAHHRRGGYGYNNVQQYAQQQRYYAPQQVYQQQYYPPVDTADPNYANQLIWWRGYRLLHTYYQPFRLTNGQTLNIIHYVLVR
jgi:uncharacterized protein YceK